MRLKGLFFGIVMLLPTMATAQLSSECEKYTDCDMVAACELAIQAERAAAGQSYDFEGAIVQTIKWRTACANYAGEFTKNIDVTLSDNPPVRMVINWDSVRNRVASGGDGNFDDADLAMLDALLNILGADTQAQEKFFRALASAYIVALNADDTLILNDSFILEWLGENDNLAKYSTGLRDLTGTIVIDDENLTIDIDWDNILIEVSNVLDVANQKRSLLVCENNRSYQIGIDGIGYAAAAVAAFFTLYAGGAGGAGVVAVKAGVGELLKGASKIAIRKTTKKALKTAGGKLLSKQAVKVGMRGATRNFAQYKGKGVLRKAAKNYIKEVGKNMITKRALLADAGVALWYFGKNSFAGSAMGTMYSLVSSDLDTSYVNCQDVDYNEGCYTVCGHGNGSDDLNQKVFLPILGKTYCVDEKTYALHEMKDGVKGERMLFDGEKWPEIRAKMESSVADLGHCDRNEDDIDVYAGRLFYDPDTMKVDPEAMTIDAVLRIDD